MRCSWRMQTIVSPISEWKSPFVLNMFQVGHRQPQQILIFLVKFSSKISSVFSQTLRFQIKMAFDYLSYLCHCSWQYTVSFYTTSAKDGADISIVVNIFHLCIKLVEVSNMLIFAFVFTFCLIPAPHSQIFKCHHQHIPLILTDQ